MPAFQRRIEDVYYVNFEDIFQVCLEDAYLVEADRAGAPSSSHSGAPVLAAPSLLDGRTRPTSRMTTLVHQGQGRRRVQRRFCVFHWKNGGLPMLHLTRVFGRLTDDQSDGRDQLHSICSLSFVWANGRHSSLRFPCSLIYRVQILIITA